MSKCRLCLKQRKKIRSIFSGENGTSFVSMTTSIANVKIQNDDGLPDQICYSCSRRLREAYKFKVCVERCDKLLHETANTKKISFNNLKDIKIEIEIADLKPTLPSMGLFSEKLSMGGENVMSYNDTLIKKIERDYNGNDNGPLPVMEFLKTLKTEPECDYMNEPGNDYDYAIETDSGAGSDIEYTPHTLRKKKKIKQYKRIQEVCAPIKPVILHNIYPVLTNSKIHEGNIKCDIPIKPIILNDMRLVPCKIMKKTQHKEAKVVSRRRSKIEHVCPYCGILTKTLQSHILVHSSDRPFRCDQCSKGFFTKNLLIRHMKKHSDVKNYKCGQCVAAFHTAVALKSHKLMHSEKKNHVCEICSKAFKRKYALQRHIMYSHNMKPKTVKCDLCNMSFYNNYGLRHHMRVHTGERPYNCEICSQPYSYKHDFNRHCFKKHGIFLKRRSVNVMNEEVLKQEREVMKSLMLKARGILKDGEPLNPFEGPQAALAFELAMKAIRAKQIPMDVHI